MACVALHSGLSRETGNSIARLNHEKLKNEKRCNNQFRKKIIFSHKISGALHKAIGPLEPSHAIAPMNRFLVQKSKIFRAIPKLFRMLVVRASEINLERFTLLFCADAARDDMYHDAVTSGSGGTATTGGSGGPQLITRNLQRYTYGGDR
jgi:hypothetical protein